MTQTNIVTQADFADALITAKRAKNIFFVLTLLVLLIELAVFFAARYSKILDHTDGKNPPVREIVQYGIGLLDFAGLIIPTLLGLTLLLILLVMLVGRLLGVARLTSAFLWSLVLVLLMFPWQAVLNNPVYNTDTISNDLGLKIPGVVYTWAELDHPKVGAHFATQPMDPAVILHWARYVGFPLLSVLILMLLQAKSDRGLRQALGTSAPIVIETTPTNPR